MLHFVSVLPFSLVRICVVRVCVRVCLCVLLSCVCVCVCVCTVTASVVVWYGREQVKFRGQFAVRAGRVLPIGGDRTVSYAEGGKSREFPPACPGGKKAKEKAYNTCCSQAVPHPGTGQARHCLR